MQLGAMNNPCSTLLDEIKWIASNGFDFIDLRMEAPAAALERTDWGAVQAVINDAGVGAIAHAANDLPVNTSSPVVRQAAMDELRRTIDAAQIVGAKLCTIVFAGWPTYFSEADGYEYYRQLFLILLKHGAERGVDLALENSSKNLHQLKYLREILHRLPTLQLAYDIGHGNIETVRSITQDYLFALGQRLTHVHISDNDGKGDANLPFGAPTSGGINLQKELSELKKFSYAGTITVQVYGDRRWLLASTQMLREVWSETK